MEERNLCSNTRTSSYENTLLEIEPMYGLYL
nr:MAG TPA: hypothetical protein [Caudoviricetes sp.]